MDEDGTITEDEFACIIQSALGVPELDVSMLFKEIDADETGKLSYGKLHPFVTKSTLVVILTVRVSYHFSPWNYVMVLIPCFWGNLLKHRPGCFVWFAWDASEESNFSKEISFSKRSRHWNFLWICCYAIVSVFFIFFRWVQGLCTQASRICQVVYYIPRATEIPVRYVGGGWHWVTWSQTQSS